MVDSQIFGQYLSPLLYAINIYKQGHITPESYVKFEQATVKLAKNPTAFREYVSAYQAIDQQLVQLRIGFTVLFLSVMIGLTVVLALGAHGKLPVLVEGVQKAFGSISENSAKAVLGVTEMVTGVGAAYVAIDIACSRYKTGSSTFFTNPLPAKTELKEKVDTAKKGLVTENANPPGITK